MYYAEQTEKGNIGAAVCSACNSNKPLRSDKRCIGIDDIQGSYKDLSYQFCEDCGNVSNVDFS